MIDDATARTLTLIVSLIGGPAVLVSLGRSIFKWYTGRSGRERQRNRSALDDLRGCEERIDQEITRRRKALEYASKLTRQLIEAGIAPVPWPDDLEPPRSLPIRPKRPRPTK